MLDRLLNLTLSIFQVSHVPIASMHATLRRSFPSGKMCIFCALTGEAKHAGAIHLPYEGSPDKFQKALKLSLDQEGCPLQKQRPALVVCRQGNDSQVVARLMHNVFGIPAMDLEGGLLSLARSDYSLPAL